MAKAKKKEPSAAAKARQLARIDAKEEAQQLAKIREQAYKRGMRAAARFQAKQEGIAAGMRSEKKKRR